VGEADITAAIERIAALDLSALRALWAERYGDPPALRSVPLLRQLLAWRIQAEAFGDLDRETRRALERKWSDEVEGLNLGIGARLRRVWQGRTHEVIVEVDGFLWEGETIGASRRSPPRSLVVAGMGHGFLVFGIGRGSKRRERQTRHAAKAPAMRHLNPQEFRRGARSGLQQP